MGLTWEDATLPDGTLVFVRQGGDEVGEIEYQLSLPDPEDEAGEDLLDLS